MSNPAITSMVPSGGLLKRVSPRAPAPRLLVRTPPALALRWSLSSGAPQGITSGTSADIFAPNATVTRAQTVTFLYRAAGSPAVSGGSFSDVAANAYYANAIAWASQNNITSGTGGGKFSPSSDCTRGQIVTLLYRANSN